MLDFLPLNLFPVSSLASSVVTTVWIGVTVVVFFNLRLGWVLSGLVVPGYMVPLLILKPWAATVIFIEGIFTYLLVWFLFEKLSKIGLWSSIFGRDRFFALVLVSVGVRIGFDGWLWPELGAWINQIFHIQFDYRNNLQSFGLIVIALIANQFWKTGVIRGIVPMFVITAVVYVIIRFGFMELTNFTISNVAYMYEDIASSILASPKSYIILLCVAMVASRMNLIYGWDFSGILIPSLLALQWYQPTKILATFIEAFIILFIAHFLLKLTWFKNANIEAARKLLLFFNIGFAYKFMLAYVVLWFFPDTKITDTYAFGYLLATLLALKMHDKDIAARMTRATLQTSLTGVMIASVIGFSLTYLPSLSRYDFGESLKSAQALISRSDLTLLERMQQDKVRFYRTLGNELPVALPNELTQFSTAMKALKVFRSTKESEDLNYANDLLSQLSYHIEKVEERYLYISEKDKVRGWGSYVLDLERQDGLLVSVPRPLEERGSMEAAEVIFKSSRSHAFALAGTRSDSNADHSAAVLLNPQTLFQVFHATFAGDELLQVRTYNNQLRRLLAPISDTPLAKNVEYAPTLLWVKTALPQSLDLPFIQGRTDKLEIKWGNSPLSNRQRDMMRQGFSEIFLNKVALRKIRAYALLNNVDFDVKIEDQRIDGYLQEWILGGRQAIVAAGSDKYIKPTIEQLLFFDEEVLTPLIDVINSEYQQGDWSSAGREDVRLIGSMAAVMGYQLMQYRHRLSKQDFIVLYENPDNINNKHWGTYVFRLGNKDHYLVQVPRPLHEVNSFEYGVALFERLKANLLSIAGADPDANQDGSADLVRGKNMKSLFSLVNQVVLRESGDLPMMVIHSRARGYRPDMVSAHEDAILSFKRYQVPKNDALSQNFLNTLIQDGLSFRYVDGSLETVGYEASSVSQSRYLSATENKQFWVVWLSPIARSRFRQQSQNKLEIGRFTALGITTLEKDLAQYLSSREFSTQKMIPNTVFVAQMNEYLQSKNIIALSNILSDWPQYKMLRLVDRDSRQSFLLVHNQNDQPIAVINLNSRDVHLGLTMASGLSVEDFIFQRAAWLFSGKMP